MPIPAFDHNLVLPPHTGDPTDRNGLSPFACTTVELVRRFATSKERKEILGKFLQFRAELQNRGLHVGYQWLDGVWKGMLRIELNTPAEDQAALDYLNSI